MGISLQPIANWVVCRGKVDGDKRISDFDRTSRIFIQTTTDNGSKNYERAARAARPASHIFLDGGVWGVRTDRVCGDVGARFRVAGGVGFAGNSRVGLVFVPGIQAGGAAADRSGDCGKRRVGVERSGRVLDWHWRDKSVGMVVVAAGLVPVGGFDCVCGAAIGTTGLEGGATPGNAVESGRTGVGLYGIQFGIGTPLGVQGHRSGGGGVGICRAVCGNRLGRGSPGD